MAAENIAVQQDTGSGPGADLNQGEASAINDALPTQTVPDASGQPGATPEAAAPTAADTAEPDQAQPSDYEPIFTPENDDEAFLTGPTTRPNEPVTAGAFAPATRQLPPDAATWLPAFAEAASLPDAPPQLVALVRMLTDAAES